MHRKQPLLNPVHDDPVYSPILAIQPRVVSPQLEVNEFYQFDVNRSGNIEKSDLAAFFYEDTDKPDLNK